MKMPNCSQYGEMTTQRPEFIEEALNTHQPANTDEYRCVGVVISFDMITLPCITLPCDMKFSASFICEDIADNTKTDNQNIRGSNVSSSFHLMRKDGRVVLNTPQIDCPLPWIQAQHECFILQPARLPKQISRQWLTHKCDLLNASTFIFPHAFTDSLVMPGLSSQGDLFISATHEMRRRGSKLLIMKGESPSKCVLFYADRKEYDIIHCLINDTRGLPEPVHVLCTKSIPAEEVMYNMISTYTCSTTGVIISASFHCDGIIQCEDGDDEINCTSHNVLTTDCSPFSLQMHKDTNCLKCPEFYTACGNGNCVPQDALCNGISDCEDGWDEQICIFIRFQLSFDTTPKRNPVFNKCDDNSLYDADYYCIFELDERNNILHCSDGSHMPFECETFSCPQAFKCLLSYCIPVRQVCDGVSDCPAGEDEVNCDRLQCTGLFQCRQSSTCLPPWDICDGTVHCKDFLDDEIYCAPCPYGMLCHGNAAVCQHSIDDDLPMITVRSQSWVKVVHCHHKRYLRVLSDIKWHTLTYLNVQHSEISHLDFDQLCPNMKALSYLNAAFNRIVLIRSQLVIPLKIINLSNNMIPILWTFGLRQFPDLVTLVIHHNEISVIQRWAFFGLKSLASVDITHNPLAIHEVSDLPQGSLLLEHFQSDILAVCCLLPHVPHCAPRSSLFSSCENLLHLTVHRMLITGQAIFTLIANSAVFIFKHKLNKQEKSQMIQLAASNLLMSVYLMLMAGVDVYYRDRFASIAVSWNYLSLCKVAASASLIAAEVSLSLLLLISIFRAYSVHKVWHTVSSRFRTLACFAIWAVWVVYTSTISGMLSSAGIPLESNICMLVYFKGATRYWLVLVHNIIYVTVNMLKVISLIVSYGFIVCSVLRKNPATHAVSAKMVNRNRTLATKLFIMFFFNACCWVPMISSVILGLFDVQLPSDVPVWMAIIVVPINASFCPIMYCLVPMLVNGLKKI